MKKKKDNISKYDWNEFWITIPTKVAGIISNENKNGNKNKVGQKKEQNKTEKYIYIKYITKQKIDNFQSLH